MNRVLTHIVLSLGKMILAPFSALFSFTHGVDNVYPGVPGARYWTEDPWCNGPMVGPGADTQIHPGQAIDTYAVQPAKFNYGVPMVGMYTPIPTETYQANWAPNAI
mmetsp:Transcript_3264/g.8202  ORF Transcript_3264/g.8202 Transcript_3264/m.8202 type:complete len:106 (-) Transcript_3264:325-642(-)